MQGTCEWHLQCKVRITASQCKTVASLKSDSAISNYLNSQLWCTDQHTTCALVYELKNESIARLACQTSKDGNTLQVQQTCFWVNCMNPDLAASPNGLILGLTEPNPHYGVLEKKF